MRTILVNPPTKGTVSGQQSGLVIMKNYLQKRNIRIDIMDLSAASEKEMEVFISSIHEHDLIGITVATATYQSGLEVARACKNAQNDCQVILGGPHIQNENPIVILDNNPEIDFLCLGDGEKTLFHLITEPTLSNVPGIAYRKNETVISNHCNNLSSQELEEEVYEMDPNDFHCPLGKLQESKKSSILQEIPLVSSRGCPKSCPFCSVGGQKVRSKSPDKILGDVTHILSQGYTHINFEDNFFGLNLKKVKKLCQKIIDRNLRFTWDCQTRVELARHPEIIHLMHQAGCRRIFLGIENLSPEGSLMIKDISGAEYSGMSHKAKSSHYINLTRLMIEVSFATGITPNVMLQLGIPDETKKIRQENISELTHLGNIAQKYGTDLTVFVMITTLYPGTPLFHKYQKAYNWPDDIFEKWTEWEHENREEFIFSTFPHGVGGIPISLIDLKTLPTHINWKSLRDTKKYLESISIIPNITVPEIGRYLV